MSAELAESPASIQAVSIPQAQYEIVTIEIDEQLDRRLRQEYRRMCIEANPKELSWDWFLEGVVIIGLQKLATLSPEQVLEQIASLEEDEGQSDGGSR